MDGVVPKQSADTKFTSTRTDRELSNRHMERSRIASQIGESVDIKIDGDVATLKHQGLNFTDFDRKTGHANLYHILQYTAGCRYFASNSYEDSAGKPFFDLQSIAKKFTTFMISSEAMFSKALYDANVKKTPIISKVTVRHIGKTSYTTKTSLYTGDGNLLTENSNRIVCIDKVTKKPSMLPDWWYEKYKHLSVDENQLKVDKLIKPDKIECFQVKVRWSDTDHNNHTNWASYHKFCLDAAYYFARETIYQSTTEEMLQKGIKSYRCVYLGESVMDDLLDIVSWDTDGVLKFDISKGGQSIFQNTIEIF